MILALLLDKTFKKNPAVQAAGSSIYTDKQIKKSMKICWHPRVPTPKRQG